MLAKALSGHGYDVEILSRSPRCSMRNAGPEDPQGFDSTDSILKVYSSKYLSKDYSGFSLKLIRMFNRVVNNNVSKIIEEVDIDMISSGVPGIAFP